MALNDVQRAQMGMLPIAGGGITAGDRHAFGGLVQALSTSGPLIETFDVTWYLDPTWTVQRTPQVNAGHLGMLINSLDIAFEGLEGVPNVPVLEQTVSVDADDHTISVQADDHELAVAAQDDDIIVAVERTRIVVQ
jgi:hypothetical protein